MIKSVAKLFYIGITAIILLSINGCSECEFFDWLGTTETHTSKEKNKTDKDKDSADGVSFSDLSAQEIASLNADKQTGRLYKGPTPVKILKMYRPDYYVALINGITQSVHLTGIVSPDTQRNAHTIRFAQQFGVEAKRLPEVAREARAFLEGLLEQKELTWYTTGVVTSKSGSTIFEGDLRASDNSYVTDILLSRGYAHIYKPLNTMRARQLSAQRKAQMAEIGIWYNPLPIPRRFHVDTTFEDMTLNTTRNKRTTSDKKRTLEMHLTEERQGVVNIDISVSKPVTRQYTGTVHYTFLLREEKGVRRQEKTSAPIGSDSISGNDIRSQQSKVEKNKENIYVENYNKSVHDQRVFDTIETGRRDIEFVVDTDRTNLMLFSSVRMLTKSTKAGFKYNQGFYHVGCNLDIYIGTNLIYRNRYNN